MVHAILLCIPAVILALAMWGMVRHHTRLERCGDDLREKPRLDDGAFLRILRRTIHQDPTTDDVC